MSKAVHDDVLNSLLNYIANNCKRVTICSSQPTTYLEANSTYKLADVDVTEGVGNGDFALADGTISGRKLIVSQQSGVPVDSNGSAQHVALLDVDNSKLLAVTTCTQLTLNAGNTITIPSFDIEVSDPS